MATQVMASQDARIGRFKGEILKHVMPQEVIGRVGVSMKKSVPKNSSETVVFRRWLPKGATVSTPNTWNVNPSEHRLNEGETPNAENMIAQDITVALQEFGVLYRYTNRVADMYEDDVPGEMKRMTGERMGLLLEMVRWGQLRAGTNVFFPTSAITTRANVGGAAGQLVSPGALRRIARAMSQNLASKVTDVLAASPGVKTEPVEAAFIAVCSTDLEADLRSQLPGFIHVSEYGTRRPVHPNELGSWEQYRFVTSPHLAPYIQQGGTFGTAGAYLSNGAPNTGSNAADVYPILVMAEECYGDVMLRGMDSFDVTMISPNQKTKDDPLGQRGYVGAQCYFNAVRLNEGHMAILEVPATAL